MARQTFTDIPMIDGRQQRGAEPSLLPLFAWLSPAYPVGSYAYSHGLEWAVEAGDVSDESSLAEWLRDLVDMGVGRSDAILLSHAYRSIADGDTEAFGVVNDLALALAPSAELYLETSQQGRSFLDATASAWPSSRLPVIKGEVAYPAAVGAAAAAHSIPLSTTLEAFLFAFVQNMISAAIRLAPIGQSTGTRVCASLRADVEAVAREAEGAALDDIASSTFRVDLGSFHHETQYTRIFRS
jgi:urease accessory protein